MTDKENRKYYVYKHTLPNGKYYIGATYRGENRWGKNGEGYKSSGKIFYSQIIKYGWDNIKHEILYSNLSKDEARKIERELIIEAQNRGMAINKNRGGYDILNKKDYVTIAGLRLLGLSYREIGDIFKMDASAASYAIYNKVYLKYYTQEDFDSEVMLFVKHNKMKYVREDGKTFNKNGVPSRRVIQIDKDNNIVAKFESISEAAKANNVLSTSIQNNLKGLSKLCGGYKYEYE